eukprot:2479763-Rhodomonas_salina.1
MNAADRRTPSDRKLGKLYSMFVSPFKSKSRSNSQEIHIPDDVNSPDIFGMALNSKTTEEVGSTANATIPGVYKHSSLARSAENRNPSRKNSHEDEKFKDAKVTRIAENRNRSETNWQEGRNTKDDSATRFKAPHPSDSHRSAAAEAQDLKELFMQINIAQSSGHVKILRRPSTDAIRFSDGTHMKLAR